MNERPKLDPARAADRRRFYLERGLRKATFGSGSDLARLMRLPRSNWTSVPSFEGLATMLEALLAAPVLNRLNQRVMPLPYLVLMKLDSARGVDQGDLTRMLGRVEPSVVEEIVAVVQRHYSDDRIAEDIRQYAEIGRWEYGL